MKDTKKNNWSLIASKTVASTPAAEQEYKQTEGKWTTLLLLAGLVTTVGASIPFGFNLAVINTPASTIQSFCNESLISRYNVTLGPSGMNILWSSIVSIFIIGGCVGSVCGAIIADSIGRKGALYIINILELIGAATFYFCSTANSVEMLIAGRLLTGLAGGITVSVIPMYLMELAPLKLMGNVGVWCPLGVTVGVLLGQVMGLESILGGAEHWPTLLSIYGVLVLVCAPVVIMLPESPKYLYIVRSCYDLGIKELARIRGVPAKFLTDEIAQFHGETRSNEGGRSFDMLSIARDSRLSLPLLLVCSMQAGQQLSGINAVFYYSSSTFTAAGLDAHGASLATLGAGVTNCVASLLALGLSARSRRSTILLSIGGVIASLVLLGVSGALSESVYWMSYISVAATMLFVFACGIGLGPIPFFIGSELFEVGPRPAAMSWGSLANWSGNFIIGMSFPSIQALIGPYSFLMFSVAMTGLFLFLRTFLPETQGKTAAEVADLCRDGLRSKPLRVAPEPLAIPMLRIDGKE